jgi:hypothetical protein
MGVAAYAVLAQIYQVRQLPDAVRVCAETIANVALLEIDLKVASFGADYGVDRYHKGTG